MSSEAAMSGTEASEAAGAALHGLKQRKSGRVSEDEHKLLLQRYERTLCMLQTACEDRDKAHKLFLEHQRVSKAVIVKVDKKCETLQADLHACQKELIIYEQDRQQKVAEIEQIHLRYEVQLAALKTEGAGMQRTIRDLQQQLSKKEVYAKEIDDLRGQLAAHKQELYCCKQELTAVKAENQELKELNSDVQQLVEQAKVDMGSLMKMLSAAQQLTDNSNKVSVGTTTDDDDLSQSTDNITQQQAQVQVVFDLKVSSDEEARLKALNTSLQNELVLHKQLLCLHKQQLKAVRVKSKQLQEGNKQLEQMLFDVTEQLVELEQKRPAVVLVVNVDEDKDEPVQPVVSLTINLIDTTEEATTQAVNDVKDQLAAAHCHFAQEMTAVKVDNSQLQDQVIALRQLVAEKDDKIQELQQRPQVTVAVNVVDDRQNNMMVDQVVQQMTGLKQQVSVLMHSKQYLEAELVNRSIAIIQNQQQLSAAMQMLKDLQVAAAPAPMQEVNSCADADRVIAAQEQAMAACIKDNSSSSSMSSSLLNLKRRFTAGSSSISQPGTPGTPALTQTNSFAVGRGSSSRSSSGGGSVDQHGADVDGSLSFTAADGDDSTDLLLSHENRQSRTTASFKNIQRRVMGPFGCLMKNSSNMVKEY